MVSAGAKAGIMESSSGSATAVPAARNTVRRDMDFFVTNIILLSSIRRAGHWSAGSGLAGSHLKFRTLHNTHDHGRPTIVVARRGAIDRAHRGRIVILQSTAQ